jgi:hypothetical protein
MLITVAAIAVIAVVLAFAVNQWSVSQHMYPQDAFHESSNLAVRGIVTSVEENHKCSLPTYGHFLGLCRFLASAA